jgi:hypothetical protein
MAFVGRFLSNLFVMSGSEEKEEVVEAEEEEEEEEPTPEKRMRPEEEEEEVVEAEEEEEEPTPEKRMRPEEEEEEEVRPKKVKTSPPPTPAAAASPPPKALPLDIQNKRLRWLKDTSGAILEVDTASNKLLVRVKRGKKGRKEKQLPPYDLLKDKNVVQKRIAEEMEKQSMKYVGLTELVINFPDLYWNTVFFSKKNLSLIENFLKESGFCNTQTRRR